MTVSDRQRIWNKVEETETCWHWRGCVNRNGYPIVWLDGEMQYVRPLVLKIYGKPVPCGRKVLNQCGNGRCINPEHHRVSTRKKR